MCADEEGNCGYVKCIHDQRYGRIQRWSMLGSPVPFPWGSCRLIGGFPASDRGVKGGCVFAGIWHANSALPPFEANCSKQFSVRPVPHPTQGLQTHAFSMAAYKFLLPSASCIEEPSQIDLHPRRSANKEFERNETPSWNSDRCKLLLASLPAFASAKEVPGGGGGGFFGGGGCGGGFGGLGFCVVFMGHLRAS